MCPIEQANLSLLLLLPLMLLFVAIFLGPVGGTARRDYMVLGDDMPEVAAPDGGGASCCP